MRLSKIDITVTRNVNFIAGAPWDAVQIERVALFVKDVVSFELRQMKGPASPARQGLRRSEGSSLISAIHPRVRPPERSTRSGERRPGQRHCHRGSIHKTADNRANTDHPGICAPPHTPDVVPSRRA